MKISNALLDKIGRGDFSKQICQSSDKPQPPQTSSPARSDYFAPPLFQESLNQTVFSSLALNAAIQISRVIAQQKEDIGGKNYPSPINDINAWLSFLKNENVWQPIWINIADLAKDSVSNKPVKHEINFKALPDIDTAIVNHHFNQNIWSAKAAAIPDRSIVPMINRYTSDLAGVAILCSIYPDQAGPIWQRYITILDKPLRQDHIISVDYLIGRVNAPSSVPIDTPHIIVPLPFMGP